MFSITKKYTDYNGVEKEETFWFNLNKSELAKMIYGPAGGLQSVMERLINEGATGETLALFEDIVLASYGKKMPDGRFAKIDENGHRYADLFRETAVYDEIFMDIVLNTNSLVAFFTGVVPAGMTEQMAQQMGELKNTFAVVQ